jgi:Raf kinase inhibitor-like YbhB/YbcL family protein
MLEKLPPGIGEALRDQRAGLEQTVLYRLRRGMEMPTIVVRSSAFDPNQSIPVRYTADGSGVSPPLEWRGVPASASSVAVIVEDADSPTPHPLVHAIVVNVDPRESSLIEGALNSPDHSGVGLDTGLNSYLSHAWLPPDPPPGHGLHRYVFQVFALRGSALSDAPGRQEVVRAIEDCGVAAGCVIGTYERAQRIRASELQQTEVEAAPEVNASVPA